MKDNTIRFTDDDGDNTEKLPKVSKAPGKPHADMWAGAPTGTHGYVLPSRPFKLVAPKGRLRQTNPTPDQTHPQRRKALARRFKENISFRDRLT